jgi:hypothetical protein
MVKINIMLAANFFLCRCVLLVKYRLVGVSIGVDSYCIWDEFTLNLAQIAGYVGAH